jgi:transposase InsO family protein
VVRARRRYKVTTMSDHDQPVAANVLDRQFTADRPNHRWVGDTSEFLVGSGTKLFVAAILDLYSRYVVGWAVSAVNDGHLTIKALRDGDQTWVSRSGVAPPLGSRLHVRQRGLSAMADDARHHLQYEPARQLLRQCRDGELLLDREV